MSINFDIFSCVRTYYRYANCSKCADICPVENTIYIENDKVKTDFTNCVNCGACVGVCPTESFNFNNFDITEKYYQLVENPKPFLSCKADLPCLSILNEEYLVSLALNTENDIILDTGHCKNCFIGKLEKNIKENVEKANYILETLKVEQRIKIEDIQYKPENKEEKSRRSFLSSFFKQATVLAFWSISEKLPVIEEEKEEKEFKNIVQEKVNTKKREIFLNSIREKVDLTDDKYFEVDKIDFSSDKYIDNNLCTNCGICYNVCPTGALSTDESRLKIIFSPSICIKCKICHDVCPEKCLHLEEKLYIKDFVSNGKILSTHIMIPCEECLVPFSYKGDSTICPRCRRMEDELKDLLKIGD